MASSSIQRTRDEIGTESENSTIQKRFSQSVKIIRGPWVAKDRTIEDSFIIGHEINGITEAASAGDLQPFIEDNRGTPVVIRVENYNNTWIEPFENTDFYDSANSSGATWDTSTNTLTVDPNGYTQTTAVFYDSTGTKTFNTVEINATITSGSPVFKVSADGTSPTEEVANNTETTLSTSGSEIILKIEDSVSGPGWPTPFGSWGAATGIGFTISRIELKYS